MSTPEQLAYRGGGENCTDPRCARIMTATGTRFTTADGTFCVGWHCAHCGEPCGPQGHHCQAEEPRHG